MKVDPGQCPLCAGDNDCGMVAGRLGCWCGSAAFPRELLDRVPDEALGRACVCARCLVDRQRRPTLRRRALYRLKRLLQPLS